MRMYLMLCAALFAAMFGVHSAAHAEVVATFYSQDFGGSFPHAFVKLKGTDDVTGAAVDTNYGFTAKNIGPGLLMGSVKGRLDVAKQSYIDDSDAHFSVRLSDAQYKALMTEVRRWAAAKQPSYNLNKANCVHFIAGVAQSIGLKINSKTELLEKNPKASCAK